MSQNTHEQGKNIHACLEKMNSRVLSMARPEAATLSERLKQLNVAPSLHQQITNAVHLNIKSGSDPASVVNLSPGIVLSNATVRQIGAARPVSMTTTLQFLNNIVSGHSITPHVCVPINCLLQLPSS